MADARHRTRVMRETPRLASGLLPAGNALLVLSSTLGLRRRAPRGITPCLSRAPAITHYRSFLSSPCPSPHLSSSPPPVLLCCSPSSLSSPSLPLSSLLSLYLPAVSAPSPLSPLLLLSRGVLGLPIPLSLFSLFFVASLSYILSSLSSALFFSLVAFSPSCLPPSSPLFFSLSGTRRSLCSSFPLLIFPLSPSFRILPASFLLALSSPFPSSSPSSSFCYSFPPPLLLSFGSFFIFLFLAPSSTYPSPSPLPVRFLPLFPLPPPLLSWRSLASLSLSLPSHPVPLPISSPSSSLCFQYGVLCASHFLLLLSSFYSSIVLCHVPYSPRPCFRGVLFFGFLIPYPHLPRPLPNFLCLSLLLPWRFLWPPKPFPSPLVLCHFPLALPAFRALFFGLPFLFPSLLCLFLPPCLFVAVLAPSSPSDPPCHFLLSSLLSWPVSFRPPLPLPSFLPFLSLLLSWRSYNASSSPSISLRPLPISSPLLLSFFGPLPLPSLTTRPLPFPLLSCFRWRSLASPFPHPPRPLPFPLLSCFLRVACFLLGLVPSLSPPVFSFFAILPHPLPAFSAFSWPQLPLTLSPALLSAILLYSLLLSCGVPSFEASFPLSSSPAILSSPCLCCGSYGLFPLPSLSPRPLHFLSSLPAFVWRSWPRSISLSPRSVLSVPLVDFLSFLACFSWASFLRLFPSLLPPRILISDFPLLSLLFVAVPWSSPSFPSHSFLFSSFLSISSPLPLIFFRGVSFLALPISSVSARPLPFPLLSLLSWLFFFSALLFFLRFVSFLSPLVLFCHFLLSLLFVAFFLASPSLSPRPLPFPLLSPAFVAFFGSCPFPSPPASSGHFSAPLLAFVAFLEPPLPLPVVLLPFPLLLPAFVAFFGHPLP
ncbi:hypothetical protein C7M84_012411 [Penaeus vannamei]|uniref:Uncharacterized protein n=1 Tax=Penaeus vannamei TaxID=6689 RepID=A0A3R7Q5X4_PENVA|nr:hypothetical protein C7M84_012411 [Penaeus vannamei]